MAASDEAELVRMINTTISINDRPCAFRYPRGTGIGIELPGIEEKLEIGKGRILQEGKKLGIINFGARLSECLKASENLKKKGINILRGHAYKPLTFPYRSNQYLETKNEGMNWLDEVKKYLKMTIVTEVTEIKYLDRSSLANQNT